MYIHGFVVLPVPLSIAVRQFYEICLTNMPWALFRLVHGIRFRFYFHYNPEVTSIRISQMFYPSGNLTPTANLTRLFICNFFRT